MTIKLFISYSHKDAKYKEALENHLAPLQDNGVISLWYDKKIIPGEKWPFEIERHIRESDIILLLFSRDFISSKACEKEVALAKELEKNAEAIFIPVILRECLWKDVPGMSEVKALPDDAHAVSAWKNQDEAWLSVCNGIKASIEKIKRNMAPQTENQINKVASTNSASDAIPKNSEEMSKRERVAQELHHVLEDALTSYEGQPSIWTDRVVYKRSDTTGAHAYDDEVNIQKLIKNPYSLFIFDKPMSGFTCLARYLVLEAWKNGKNWLYLSADKIPLERKDVGKYIEKACIRQSFSTQSLLCLVLDGWKQNVEGMPKRLRNLSSVFEGTPLIVMSSDETPFSSSAEKLNRKFTYAGLKPLTRHGIREIVTKYNAEKDIGDNNVIVGKIVSDMDVLNIHRTPQHCLTLLKVYEKFFEESLVNRTKMVSILLGLLFHETKIPAYSTKPDVEHCEYLLGFFCEKLIKEEVFTFGKKEFFASLNETLEKEKIDLEVEIIFDILYQNKIIIEDGSNYKFRHVFWAYYFAAHCMDHNEGFREYITAKGQYLSFPEIIEFYTGINRKRNDLIEMLAKDLREQCDNMESELGISHIVINPLDFLKKVDGKENMEKTFEHVRKEILETKLPDYIKDEYADKHYDMTRPDNQNLYNFYKDYKFAALNHKIRTCCRALRNSEFVTIDRKEMMIGEIMRAWSLFSQIAFILSPILAKDNSVYWEGHGFVLDSGFQQEDLKKKIFAIWANNPHNIVNFFGDDLHSDRLSTIFQDKYKTESDVLARHLLIVFLIRKKPKFWTKMVREYMGAADEKSVYFDNIRSELLHSYRYDFANPRQIAEMKELVCMWYAKTRHDIRGNLSHRAKVLLKTTPFPPREAEKED